MSRGSSSRAPSPAALTAGVTHDEDRVIEDVDLQIPVFAVEHGEGRVHAPLEQVRLHAGLHALHRLRLEHRLGRIGRHEIRIDAAGLGAVRVLRKEVELTGGLVGDYELRHPVMLGNTERVHVWSRTEHSRKECIVGRGGHGAHHFRAVCELISVALDVRVAN